MQFLHVVVKIVIGQSWSIIIRSVLNFDNLPIDVQILTGSGFDRERCVDIVCLASRLDLTLRAYLLSL